MTRMPESKKDRDPLEMLAADFVERQRKGERVSIEQYAAEHPELAEEIQELFPTIVAMERLKLQQEKSGSGQASLGPVKLERLGDYRILREIGRGGMGIVFEAEQESLARRVAIKVLPRHALLDEEHLKRFERETRIAANLHHTNIVPVFGVGEQDGFHYFVMQYIEGVSLDRAIEQLNRDHRREDVEETEDDRPVVRAKTDLSLLKKIVKHAFHESVGKAAAKEGSIPGYGPMRSFYWRRMAKIGMQAARALDYAHAQGTLHRDIKPANLLLDAQSVVWISDFGVAKALESEDVTQTGDLTGTLRYVAPERFQGREDARSDLYSLGLTLYELLTLRPAYGDSNRTRLIHCITREEPTPPRKIVPGIPRDLETVVFTAIARNPDHRYPTAGALADDLQRFLEDRPVQARRVTSLERVWRWSRRNPLVAGLAAAVLVLLLLVAAVSGVGYMNTKAANIRVTKALKGEKEQREKAQATSELALEVLDKIYAQLAPLQRISASEYIIQDSEGDLFEVPLQPVLSMETAAMLENLLVFYDRLSEQHGEDVKLMLKAAQANQRVGAIQLLLGQYESAKTAYLRSLERYEELHGKSDGENRFLIEIACIRNELGTAYRYAGEFEKAFEAYDSALKLLEPSNEVELTTFLPEHRFELARTYYFLGTRNWTGPGGDSPAFGGIPPGPEPGRRPPPPGRSDPPPSRRNDEHGPPPLHSRNDEHGLPPPHDPAPGGGEMKYLDKAIRLLRALHKEQPSVPGFRHLLACCYRDQPPDLGFKPENMNRLEEAAAILAKLVEEFPHVTEYRHDLCETYTRLDMRGPRVTADFFPVIEELLCKGLALSEELVALHPNVPSYAATQVHIMLKLGEALHRMGQGDDGEAYFRKALAVQTSLVNRFPEASIYKIWLVEVKRSLAKALCEENRLDEARSLYEESLEVLDVLWEVEPRRGHLRGLLGASCHDLADVLHRIGDEEAAEEAVRRELKYRDDR